MFNYNNFKMRHENAGFDNTILIFFMITFMLHNFYFLHLLTFMLHNLLSTPEKEIDILELKKKQKNDFDYRVLTEESNQRLNEKAMCYFQMTKALSSKNKATCAKVQTWN